MLFNEKYKKMGDIASDTEILNITKIRVREVFNSIDNYQNDVLIDGLIDAIFNNTYYSDALTRYLVDETDQSIINSLVIIFYDAIKNFKLKNNLVQLGEDFNNLYTNTINATNSIDNENRGFDINNIEINGVIENEAKYLSDRDTTHRTGEQEVISVSSKINYLLDLQKVIDNNKNLLEKYFMAVYNKVLLPIQNNERGNRYPWILTF